MSYVTLEVEIDHGKIVPKEPQKLPQQGKGILTIISGAATSNLLQGSRPFGLAKGEFHVPEDFNMPLPPEILKSFEPE